MQCECFLFKYLFEFNFKCENSCKCLLKAAITPNTNIDGISLDYCFPCSQFHCIFLLIPLQWMSPHNISVMKQCLPILNVPHIFERANKRNNQQCNIRFSNVMNILCKIFLWIANEMNREQAINSDKAH